MVTTIRELLEQRNLPAEKTVYHAMEENVLNFKLDAGDFFEVVEEKSAGNYFSCIREYYDGLETYMKSTGIQQKERDLKEEIKILKKYSTEEKTEYNYQERMAQIRKEKRTLQEEKEKKAASYRKEQQAKTGRGEAILLYKNYAAVTDRKNVTEQLPQTARAKLPEFDRMPLFSTDLSLLSEAVRKGESVGIVGGPCLFGFDEMDIILTTADGHKEKFDFSSGANTNTGRSRGLACYFQDFGKDIHDVSFVSKKMKMTRQEAYSIFYLFEFAQVLGASVYIPLPDISYAKYLKSAVSPCTEEIQKQALERFLKEAYAISDLYLGYIGKLQQEHPKVKVQTLHGRSGKTLEKFYQKREDYLHSKLLKRVTGVEEKTESVIDYITMLALPYYLGDVQHVFQVDNLYEADSARKCAKLHQGRFSFHSLLYPEYLSADGIHPVFYAAQEYKDYIEY